MFSFKSLQYLTFVSTGTEEHWPICEISPHTGIGVSYFVLLQDFQVCSRYMIILQVALVSLLWTCNRVQDDGTVDQMRMHYKEFLKTFWKKAGYQHVVFRIRTERPSRFRWLQLLTRTTSGVYNLRLSHEYDYDHARIISGVSSNYFTKTIKILSFNSLLEKLWSCQIQFVQHIWQMTNEKLSREWRQPIANHRLFPSAPSILSWSPNFDHLLSLKNTFLDVLSEDEVQQELQSRRTWKVCLFNTQ
jgi:hypothetical protein